MIYSVAFVIDRDICDLYVQVMHCVLPSLP